jgi:hypothetical protein
LSLEMVFMSRLSFVVKAYTERNSVSFSTINSSDLTSLRIRLIYRARQWAPLS